MEVFSATTILAIRHKGALAMAGDGQVTFGNTVMKHKARKIRRIYHDQVLVGFAGAVADAFALFEKFESRLEEFRGNLPRAAVELTKEWRLDKALRRLEALMIVGNKDNILLLSGSGEVIEPDDEVVAIGSGGPYALAAAKGLLHFGDELSAYEIAKEALSIASSICIYTNDDITVETL